MTHDIAATPLAHNPTINSQRTTGPGKVNLAPVHYRLAQYDACVPSVVSETSERQRCEFRIVGVPVIDQLEGIGSSLSVPSKDGRIKSLGDGLAHALRKYLVAKERDGLEALLSGRVKSLDAPEPSRAPSGNGDQEALFKIKCPDCDSAGTLAFEEGCLKCHACGYSMC